MNIDLKNKNKKSIPGPQHPQQIGIQQYCSGWFLQMNVSWYVGATGNLFDLQDRESDGDHKVLDTGGGTDQMNSDSQVST